MHHTSYLARQEAPLPNPLVVVVAVVVPVALPQPRHKLVQLLAQNKPWQEEEDEEPYYYYYYYYYYNYRVESKPLRRSIFERNLSARHQLS
jgi:hypothetical protein